MAALVSFRAEFQTRSSFKAKVPPGEVARGKSLKCESGRESHASSSSRFTSQGWLRGGLERALDLETREFSPNPAPAHV